jgi:hypothetical protein
MELPGQGFQERHDIAIFMTVRREIRTGTNRDRHIEPRAHACSRNMMSNLGKSRALPGDSGFHQAVCLWRRKSLVSSVALGEFQYGKGLAVDHLGCREDLP